jgi:hypothetical protein
MTEKNFSQIERWFDEVEDENLWKKEHFEKIKDKYNSVKDVAALVFLTSKLKSEFKYESFFLHAEHGVILIGRNLDIFEEFTKDDVRTLEILGVFLNKEYDSGFAMFSSM